MVIGSFLDYAASVHRDAVNHCIHGDLAVLCPYYILIDHVASAFALEIHADVEIFAAPERSPEAHLYA